MHIDSQGLGELDIVAPSINYAILSFPCGSAGGPDGLTSQHLKDMIGPPAGEGESALNSTLTSFANRVVSGVILAEIQPVFLAQIQLHYRRMLVLTPT